VSGASIARGVVSEEGTVAEATGLVTDNTVVQASIRGSDPIQKVNRVPPGVYA
jgi:hypothetical protein